MAPFITEELFHILKERFAGLQTPFNGDPYTVDAIRALVSETCALAVYPQPIRQRNLSLEEAFKTVSQAIYTIRNIRGEMKLQPGIETDIYIIGNQNDSTFQIIFENRKMLKALTKVKELHFEATEPPLEFASTGILDSVKIFIPLPQELLKQEKSRLYKEQEKLAKTTEKLRLQLENADFIGKAPQNLIDKQKDLLRQTESKLAELTEKLNDLK